MATLISTWIARVGLLLVILGLFTSTLTSAWLDIKWLMYKNADKVSHMLAMLVFTSASLVALPNVRAKWVFMGTALIAIAIELAQISGPRSADIADFAASCAGTATAAILFYTADIRRWLLSERS